jgi:hypothetical protein
MQEALRRANIAKSMSGARRYLAIKDCGIGRALDVKHSNQTPLHARECMIDEHEVSRNIELELRDDRAARRHIHRLNAAQRLL